MSASLLIVIKADNGYIGSSNMASVTSQVVKFPYVFDAKKAMKEILDDYENSPVKIKITLLEGTD